MKKITVIVAGISLAFTLSATPANARFLDSLKGAFSGGLSGTLTAGKEMLRTHGATALSAYATAVGGPVAGSLTHAFIGGVLDSSNTAKTKKKKKK